MATVYIATDCARVDVRVNFPIKAPSVTGIIKIVFIRKPGLRW